MKKENQVISLIFSFAFILIIIPMGFFYWYSSSYSYTNKGLKQDDEKKFAMVLNENSTFSDFPKIIGWASDFEHIKVRSKNEVEFLMKLNTEKLDNKGPKVDLRKIQQNYKTHMMILLYMFRADGLPEKYNEHIMEIIKK